MDKRKSKNLPITVMFLLIIFLFFVFHMYEKDQKISVLENRKLSMRPDLTLSNVVSGDYSKRFESYFNDQFPARDFFIELNARMNKDLLRQTVKDDVYMSENGYLLSQVEEVHASEAKKVAQRINHFADKMGEINIQVYTALMPNKSTMMESFFPSYFPSYGQKNMDLLYKELAENTNPIDSRKALEKHINENYMFFYTDHHWQAKAAFFAYQNVMNYIINKENLSDTAYGYNQYHWEIEGKPFYGSDARKTTSVNAEKEDHIMVATLNEEQKPFLMKWGNRSREGLYVDEFLEKEDRYTNRYQAYLGGDYAQLLIRNPNKPNGDHVLVIKDSYANAFIQFLVPHFKETHVLDLRHFKNMSLENYVKKNNINRIILLNNVNSIFVTPALTDFEHPGQGENQ